MEDLSLLNIEGENLWEGFNDTELNVNNSLIYNSNFDYYSNGKFSLVLIFD